MKSKHDILTEEELDSFELRPQVLELIDSATAQFHVLKKDLRILDWGCGRGRTVAKLLEMGIDAYGVDIDSLPITNGFHLFKKRGEDHEKRLVHIKTDCRTPFPDGFFHAVISDQVFEHVRDLEALVDELARISRINNFGLHNFPAKWRINEPHLLIPFVHWLPKNWIRYRYILMQLDRIPLWQGMDNMASSDRAKTYFDYSVQKTYYRPLDLILHVLNQRGFETSIHSFGRPGRILKMCLPFLLFDNNLSFKFCRWMTSNFRNVEIFTRRYKTESRV